MIDGFHINLRPTIYSKAKTVTDVKAFLKTAPKQQPNSKEAFEGNVIEFCESIGNPVGTLKEFHDGGYIDFTIIDKDGGKINVKATENGFEVEE